jgi:hypothetical protein
MGTATRHLSGPTLDEGGGPYLVVTIRPETFTIRVADPTR